MKNIYSNVTRQALDQLEAYISIKNKDLEYVFANKAALKYLGFNSLNQLTEVAPTDNEIRCPAQQCAEAFIREDQLVISQTKSIQALALCVDARGSQVLMLGTKQYWQENSDYGVVCNYQPLHNLEIINFTKILQNLDKAYTRENQFSYTIDATTEQSDFPARQAECLFYLLRGFSAKMIGKKLSISPRTVESHITKLKERFHCKSKNQLVNYAITHGLQHRIPESILQIELE